MLKVQRVSNSTIVLFVALMVVLLVFILRYLPLFSDMSVPEDLQQVNQPGVAATSEAVAKAEIILGALVDPFSLRIPVTKVGQSEGKESAEGEVPLNVSYVPQNTWNLGGIWVTKEGKYALIGDESVAVGEEIDGWKVQKITTNSVILVKDAETKTLRLEE